MLNGYEIVLILILALIFFGAKKLPELARGLGQGIREFKRASREVTNEIENMADAETYPPRRMATPAPESLPAAKEATPPLASEPATKPHAS